MSQGCRQIEARYDGSRGLERLGVGSIVRQAACFCLKFSVRPTDGCVGVKSDLDCGVLRKEYSAACSGGQQQ
jgi:hypothetical protein